MSVQRLGFRSKLSAWPTDVFGDMPSFGAMVEEDAAGLAEDEVHSARLGRKRILVVASAVLL